MLTLQSILKLHSVKNGSAPYAKPVKVVVCGVSDVYHYRNDRKPDNKMWIVGFADQSMPLRRCSTMRNICRNALLVTAFLLAMR